MEYVVTYTLYGENARRTLYTADVGNVGAEYAVLNAHAGWVELSEVTIHDVRTCAAHVRAGA